MVVLRYQGCCVFRQRISTALLSHNPLMITNIRSNQDTSGSGGDGSMTIGLHDFEANFLRLIEKIADGKGIYYTIQILHCVSNNIVQTAIFQAALLRSTKQELL